MIYTVAVTNGQWDYVAQLAADNPHSARLAAVGECAAAWKVSATTLTVRAVMTGDVQVREWNDSEDLFQPKEATR